MKKYLMFLPLVCVCGCETSSISTLSTIGTVVAGVNVALPFIMQALNMFAGVK